MRKTARTHPSPTVPASGSRPGIGGSSRRFAIRSLWLFTALVLLLGTIAAEAAWDLLTAGWRPLATYQDGRPVPDDRGKMPGGMDD